MTFEHLTPSHDPSTWDDLIATASRLPVITSQDRIVVVAAHPDDETLGAGGLIATATAAGCAVSVVVATDGDASHPHSPTYRPADLARLRRHEVRAAVRVLAPGADVHLLSLPDGRLAEHEPELIEALAGIASDATVLVSPWSHDGHPDHEAAARAVGTVAAHHGIGHWQYPIWAWHWADPALFDGHALHGLVLDERTLATKHRALAEYVTQHRPLSDAPGDEAVLGPDLLRHFHRSMEIFVTASGTPREYFETLYAAADDPWGLDDRFYEQRKRSVLLASLPRRRFTRAFEPGCATGALTVELARRSDTVVAWEPIPSAADRAAHRLRADASVHIETRSIPVDWPDGRFDLIVLSEVGYYCADLSLLTRRISSSLTDDGVLVACHWRHSAPPHTHTAEAVHAVIGGGLGRVVDHVEDDFLLQVWTRDGRSVATIDGIVSGSHR